MKLTKKSILAIVFFGAIWGIVEASVGYVLHIIPGLSIYVSGAVLFSFASLILYKAYQTTESKSALLYVGIVAAFIKAFDFFLPFRNPFKIINPMLSIIMESLAMIAVVAWLTKGSTVKKISGLWMASVGWRLLYFAYMGIQYLTSGFVYLSTVGQYLEFFGLYALGSALFGFVLLALDQRLSRRETAVFKINFQNPIPSIVAVVLAITLTVLL